MKRFLAAAALAVMPIAAHAQLGQYQIEIPGQAPSYVYPIPGPPGLGPSYMLSTPGQIPAYAYPQIGGGYQVQVPGQLPIYIRPQFGSGWRR